LRGSDLRLDQPGQEEEQEEPEPAVEYAPFLNTS